MYSSTSKDEVIIKIVGKLSLEFPELDQLKVRDILEMSLYKYTVTTTEVSLITTDIQEKIAMYLIVAEMNGLSKKTIKGYRLNLRIFSSYIHKPVAAINVTDLRLFLVTRCKKLLPGSTNGQITTLRTFFTW